MGTHISQVRSTTLDTWTANQMCHFQKYGNAKAAQYFEACLPADFRRPYASDSSQMERFIRDKYEHRRYITTENGGLGGQSATIDRFSRSASRIPDNRLGHRPEQRSMSSRQSYDNGPTIRKTGNLATSYGGRFGRNTGHWNDSMRQFSARTNLSSNSLHSTSNRPTDPMQRAGTLKQLWGMGFPQELCLKAVDVAQGDLQRSIDWILQQDKNQSKSSSLKAPPRQEQKDLLDFDDPEKPIQDSNPMPASKRAVSSLMDTESLIEPRRAEPTAAKPADGGFTNFADFNAFGQALPSAKQQASSSIGSGSTISSSTNSAVPKSLMDLYKKSPSVTISSRAGQSQPIKVPSPRHVPETPLSQKLGNSGYLQTNKTDAGLTTFESFSSKNVRPSGNETGPSQARAPMTSSTIASPAPPPTQASPLPSTATNPPPTSSPPPKEQNEIKVEAKAEIDPESGDAGQGHPVEKEDEDPFAALSLLALNTASSNSKKERKKVGKPSVDFQHAQGMEAKTVNTVKSSGINLDDLFG